MLRALSSSLPPHIQAVFIQNSLKLWTAHCIGLEEVEAELMLRLEAELLTDLPAAYMEVYEMLAIARVMKMGREEPDQYRDKAKELSIMFGDKFVHEFNVKLNEILYGK